MSDALQEPTVSDTCRPHESIRSPRPERKHRHSPSPTKVGSVQRTIVRTRSISDTVMIMRLHPHAPLSFCTVLEIGGTNLLLHSEEEQESLLEGYRELLKSLTFPLQILIRSQPLDVSSYLADLRAVEMDPHVPTAWRALAQAHYVATDELVTRKSLMTRRFYIVIPAQVTPPTRRGLLRRIFSPFPDSTPDQLAPDTPEEPLPKARKGRKRATTPTQQSVLLELASQQLTLRVEQIKNRLLGLGMTVERVAGDALVQLMYESLTPQQARRAPLHSQTIAMCGRWPTSSQSIRQQYATSQASHHPSSASPLLPVIPSMQEDHVPLLAACADCTCDALQPPLTVLPLADLLAPSYAEETPDALCLEGEYTRCLALTGLPREATAGWLAPLLQQDETMDVVLHIHPQDAAHVVQRMMRRRAELRSSQRYNARQGRADHPDVQLAEEDSESLLSKVASGEEALFATSLYVLIRATDRAQLEASTNRLLSVLHSLQLVARSTTFEQKRAFHACLPEAHNDLMRTLTLDSTTLASVFFPFLSQSVLMPGGVLEGITATGEPVMLDDWDTHLENPHRFVGAVSGAGKSYDAKIKLMRELVVRYAQGFHVAVIDPDQEYKAICDTLQGDYIRLAPGAEQHLNPFDLVPVGINLASYVSERVDRLAEKVQSLHALFDLLLAERGQGEKGATLSSSEKGVLDRALYETYRRCGITPDPTTHARRSPLLRDLYQVLREDSKSNEHTGLADRLYPYVEGSLSGLFSAPTDVQLTNRLVVFDVLEMSVSAGLRPIAVFLIADFIWTQVLRTGQARHPRALYIDEAWSLIQHPEGGRFLADLARRARKRYLRLVTITQSPDQFVDDAWGSVIAANAATKVLKKQDRTSAEAVARRFQLTTGEQHRLQYLSKPESLLLVGNQRIVMSVQANPLEHQLATTDPRETAEREQREDTLLHSEERKARPVPPTALTATLVQHTSAPTHPFAQTPVVAQQQTSVAPAPISEIEAGATHHAHTTRWKPVSPSRQTSHT